MAVQHIKNKFFLIFLSFLSLNAMEYEGVGLFQSYGKVDSDWLVQFLPYNPVIVEAGAFRGAETIRMAKKWPQGQIHAIEANPESFVILQENVRQFENITTYELALNTYDGICSFNVCRGMSGQDPNFGYASSLLPLSSGMEIYCKGPTIVLPCSTLDTWCEEQCIHQIDLLRLELEGMELQVLQKSPKILANTKIVYVKTLIHPYRNGMTSYNELRSFLQQSGFVLLSHWYQSGITGYAIFLSRELFDAYFKLSLGMYLDL